MKTPLEKMQKMFDETRRWRLQYKANHPHMMLDAAACALRESIIVECMIAAGLPRDEGLKLLALPRR
jgi:hypothetical protein